MLTCGPMSTPTDKLLSASEAAVILGFTQRRVNQLIKEGRLKAELIGNSHVISSLALARYLQTGKRNQKSNGNGHK